MNAQETNIDRLLKDKAEIEEKLREHKVSVCILFTDVVGSTAYFDNYGDTAGIAMLYWQAELAGANISRFGGKIIKTIGDSVMASFAEPSDAVQAAIEIQRAVLARNKKAPLKEQAEIRIGINQGLAFRSGADFFGNTVNLAARITKKTGPAQIVISKTVREHLLGDSTVKLNPLGVCTFEGRPEPEELFEVGWTDTVNYQTLRENLTAALTRGELIAPGASPADLLQPTPVKAGLSQNQRIGSYVLLEQLGAGGIGVVWKARDSRLNRVVALKFITTTRVGSSPTRDLLREARAASNLNHPNILTIYEVGETEDATYLAMEFVEGETIRRRLLRSVFSVSEALDIALQTAEGLAAAHRKGIVHRDLKPENIMLRTDGYVKLVDFGLAKVLPWGGGEGSETLDAVLSHNTGHLVGTFTYMSPEQARGKPVETMSDIFSFGIILHEMLTGEHPFRGETIMDTFNAILTKQPGKLSEKCPAVPEELSNISSDCLEKDIARRIPSGVELLDRLKTIDLSRPEGLPRAEVQRRPRWIKAIGVVLLALLLSSVIWFSRSGGQQTLPTSGPGIQSVAIMPFRTTAKTEETSYLAEVLPEELSSALSRSGYQVASQSDVLQLASDTDVRTAGAQLGVEAIITGTIRSLGKRYRISVEIVDTRTGFQLWSGTINIEGDGLLELGEKSTAEILSKISTTLSVKR